MFRQTILAAVPRAERNWIRCRRKYASTSKLMRNALAKFLSCKIHHDVMINISNRVSLQRFKLNRKKSATKITHNKSARNVEQAFVTRSFTVAHEFEAIVLARRKSLKSGCMAFSLSSRTTAKLVCVLLRRTQLKPNAGLKYDPNKTISDRRCIKERENFIDEIHLWHLVV